MEIKDFKKIDKQDSSLKGTFTVHIPQWDFNIFMMYFEKHDGSSWFVYPSKEYKNSQGEKKYQWLAYFGEKGKARFEDAMKKAIKPFLGSSLSHEDDMNITGDLPF